MIPQMKKSEIVNHFNIEGYSRRTIYNTINRIQLGGTINDKKKTGRSTSWTPSRENYLKRLANNRKGVSQRRLGRKLGVPLWPYVDKYQKGTFLVINVRKRLNTARNRQKKQIINAKILPTYYIDRHVAWFWTMKNILHMMVQTCKKTTTITWMTN